MTKTRNAQERLNNEVVIMDAEEVLWDSDTEASAAYDRFQEAVARAAEAFAWELRQATQNHLSEEVRVCAVGGTVDSPFLYGRKEAEAAALSAAGDGIRDALRYFERTVIQAARAGEVEIAPPSPTRCEPCDEWPQRQADGRIVCPVCEAEVV